MARILAPHSTAPHSRVQHRHARERDYQVARRFSGQPADDRCCPCQGRLEPRTAHTLGYRDRRHQGRATGTSTGPGTVAGPHPVQ